MSKTEETKPVPPESAEETQFLAVVGEISQTTIQVIDAVVSRGGFKGEELSAIGRLRDNCIGVSKIVEQKVAESQKN